MKTEYDPKADAIYIRLIAGTVGIRVRFQLLKAAAHDGSLSRAVRLALYLEMRTGQPHSFSAQGSPIQASGLITAQIFRFYQPTRLPPRSNWAQARSTP